MLRHPLGRMGTTGEAVEDDKRHLEYLTLVVEKVETYRNGKKLESQIMSQLVSF